MKIMIAQLDPTVGDIEGNVNKIRRTVERSKSDDPDLVAFPELFLTGYPPRDLLERAGFIEAVQKAIAGLIAFSALYPDIGLLFGAPTLSASPTGQGLHNSALLVHDGQLLLTQHKSLLPTYDVFDEARYFDPAPEIRTVEFKGEVLGISICEDAWNDPELWLRRHYPFDPIEVLAMKGATVMINLSASPFYVGKDKIRYRIVSSHARKHHVPFVFVNQVAGNDELIFDGRSFCVDAISNPVAVLPSFEEHVCTVDIARPGTAEPYAPEDEIASVHNALLMGIRDYLGKCGFSKSVVGLSGGIDSAVTCALATAALGSENVLGVGMPSPYSSPGSVEDARALALNLGVEFKLVPIADIFAAYLGTLSEHFEGVKEDVTEENIQARIRGNILMALSNKFEHLVLSTGNKSELAVGYCTLYGDMTGGLAVLSDVPKTMVYKLARYINREQEVIPLSTIEKPPSAELKPDQVDQDTLPPYEILDRILYYYVDEEYSLEKILALEPTLDPETVRWVIRAVNRNEYKRRQAAPGLKVTTKAFGTGRRMPIAARVRERET